MTDDVKLPPFLLKRSYLHFLSLMIEEYRNADALLLLWWQASLGPMGVNEDVYRRFNVGSKA